MIRKADRDILKQWVPMPRYLMRRFIVRHIVRYLRPRDFIEVGAGAGEMAQWMHAQGLSGLVTEISPSAIEMLQARFPNEEVEIHAGEFTSLERKTELLLSMEVLEHIEDDEATLKNWFQLVQPDGYIVISVPAKKALFSVDDEMVGHYRRYEKAELRDKLTQAGFQGIRIFSYGYPLTSITRWVRLKLAMRRARTDGRSRSERTADSGVKHRTVFLRWLLNDFVFFPFHLLQLCFLPFDRSGGYIAVAQRPNSQSAKTPSSA